jgi:eukaryotic-like serine/threonine-protein kinase
MNADADPVLDDEFTVRLLAGEEALAAGAPAESLAEDASPELRSRLLRGLACVQRLRELRPHYRQRGDDETEETCPTRIGRFEIRCPLGRGGFGIVYRAYDPVLCREVALKIPRADVLADAECLARFQREARAAAGLDHPNLVPVHEAGQLGPICYIALAYCPGSDLATWLKQRNTPVRCLEAAQLVRILARAIHYAHERGILHRDLKPSNVLLSPIAHSSAAAQDNLWLPEADSAMIPRVTDFGLAKLAAGDHAQTQSGDLLGTPAYMAPEQVEGLLGPAVPATDVYALGVILYEVITGRPPFWAESTVATLLQVTSCEPVPPGRLRPELPRDLETICLKCLHKEPHKRYANADALAEDLSRFLAGRAIQARPTSHPEQALKWVRRHPALAASLAALLLVTLLGIGGILGQWQKTQIALGDAMQQQEQAEKAHQAEAREHERSEVALYHHSVVLAHHEWQAGNVGRSAQLLDECRPDLRNWEWRYVRRLCDSAVFTCTGHSTSVSSVAFSPDGRYLASATGQWLKKDPGEVKLWDAATGALIWKGQDHTGPVMTVAFSPDGRRLASATGSWGAKAGEVKIWETATGKVLKTLSGFPPGVFGVAFSPDGSRLATAGADGKVRLWDAESGERLFALEGHKDNVFSVAFSPDGRQLASAGRDGNAIVWDLASKRGIYPPLRGPHDLRSVAFSPDGQQLVTASFDQSVKIWEAASGKLLRTYWGHRAPVLCAAFSPDGRRVASTDSVGVVNIWDVATGRILRTVRGHTGGVAWTAFDPEGRRLATAGRDRTVRVWDITRDQDVHSLPQTAGAQNVIFSPDGFLLAASGYSYSGGKIEKSVRVWSIDDPAAPRRWEGHSDWLRCVAFSHDGKLLASGSARKDRTVRLWDVATERTLCVLERHADSVTGVSFNRDGTRLASGSLDKTVLLWDVAAAIQEAKNRPSLPVLPTLVLKHPHPVCDVAYAPDGRRLVAVGDEGMAIVWDATTGTKLFALPGHSDVVERAMFSPDGRRLATAGRDNKIRIWDMIADPQGGQAAVPLHVLAGHTGRITGLSFSPDGRRLASTGVDQTIRIWDTVSGNDSLTLRGHPDTICGLAFSPDGRLLVSAGTRDIKVWSADDGKAAPSRVGSVQNSTVSWHAMARNP